MNGTAAPEFTKYPDFASDAIGGKVVFATDDFFAVCENLLSTHDPVFLPDKYTEFGKWMDGWETRRRRIPGHDWCLIKLATVCLVKGLLVDTAYFTGNYAPRYSIQGTNLTSKEEEHIPKRVSKLGSASDDSQLRHVARLGSERWPELVPITPLRSGDPATRLHYQPCSYQAPVSHIRLNLFPDGGVARLRVFAKPLPAPAPHVPLDLMSVLNGAYYEGFSNAHYGHPRNMLKPGRSSSMADGWETARRLDRPAELTTRADGSLDVPGEEWAVFKLAYEGIIDSLGVDTTHFKGNYPDTVSAEVATLSGPWVAGNDSVRWETILPKKKLSPNKEHWFNVKPVSSTHLRITIAPDGGISRVRAMGRALTK